MKKRKCCRRLSVLLLAVCMMLCICQNAYAARVGANRSSRSNRYNSNWVYWSQGASKYSGMRGYGCRMVAQAKLLMETGVVTDRSFNPDTYYEWCRSNGYINSRMLETRFGRGPGAYAQTLGKSISYDGKIQFQTNSRSRRCTQIMQYIRQGYYVILGSSSHHAYVGRSASLNSGTPVIYDSFKEWSYNISTTQNYSRYREASFDYFLIFSAGGNADISPSLTIKNPSSLTAGSVQLNASCSYTVKPSEVGICIGTSSNSLQKIGSDRINHNKNPFDIWYKLSGLNANTTYYYQFYAVVNGSTYWSGVYNFTTKASAGGNVDVSPSLTIKNPSSLTARSVQLNASCSYTVRPTEVGIYMGTSSKSLQKKDSDRINHNKNPFDIWYKLSGLSANTTYYYQFYAVVNGSTYWSGVYNFTTKDR